MSANGPLASDKIMPIDTLPGWRLWLARLLIAWTLAINLDAAVAFIIKAEAFAPGFELSGAPGAGMMRGMGILFLMWNVPYIMALIHPGKHRVSLYEAIVMQFIGVVGESILLLTFPDGHPVIAASVSRFILFDGIGLAALLGAVFFIAPRRAKALQNC
ncbi:MAG TPA: hypothetical protein PLT26_08240 [Anaerolineaceae bacterium]|nr:hypothetical protein [Anaerolineaceae bacterium]HQH85585.1 hypothetical protein [Anaerolineaceae bacterium]